MGALAGARRQTEPSRQTLPFRSLPFCGRASASPRNLDVTEVISGKERGLIFWTCAESKTLRRKSRLMFWGGGDTLHRDAAAGPSEMLLPHQEIIHALILQGGSNKYTARSVAPLLCFSHASIPPSPPLLLGVWWGGGGVVSVQSRSALFCCW